jgi:N-acetylglucosamine kinase-like BadF-type ATPase
MKLFLGIDGGQTAIKSILADEDGQIIGTGSGGPAIHFKDDEARRQVSRSLHQSVQGAFCHAGLSPKQPVESVFLGISGVNGPDTAAAAIYNELVGAQLNANLIRVDIDARIALAGAIPSMIGVVAIAGTGSIAFGMDDQGESARAGGWGYLVGDEGGAFEIGRQALVAVGRHHDGLGPETALTALILESIKAQDVSEIASLIYQDPHPKLRIAQISALAAQAALEGDSVSRGLFLRGGRGLGELVCAVSRKLDLGAPSLIVSGVGGVFQSADLIWKPFREEVLRQYPEAAIAPPIFSPLVGALLLAYRNGGIEISPSLQSRLEASLKPSLKP